MRAGGAMRVTAILAATGLIAGFSLPAAGVGSVQGSAAVAQHDEVAAGQQLEVEAAATATQARDGFAAEQAPEVVAELQYGAYQGAVPAGFAGAFQLSPVPGGRLHDRWGYRDDGSGEFHMGWDVLAAGGTPVVAVAAGTVSIVRFWSGYGQMVGVDHGGGVQTYYAHMIEGSPTVVVGQHVEAGDMLGLVGDTGYATTTHCHLEVLVDGQKTDPEPFFAPGVL